MQKICALITLLLLPTLAQAFTGKFSGQGMAHYSTGRNYQCSEIFLHLKISEQELRLHEGGYICGFLQAGFDQFKIDIRAGQLWHQDQLLGTITEDQITYQIYDPSDNSTYYFSLIKKPQSLHYFEEWHDGEKIALKVEGELIKRD